jgi:hypothetical protein
VGSGSGVGFEPGGVVPAGASVPAGAGDGEATATAVGDGLDEGAAPVGTGDGPAEGEGDAADAEPLGPGPFPGFASGDGLVTTATGGGDPIDRCCRPTPPMASAMVARTRFRTPRLRTIRAR